MIHPSCTQVLCTIQTSFEEQIVPHIADGEARSAAATIGHLLRHVVLRIEDEGQILTDDIARLRTLLTQIAAWFDVTGLGDSAGLQAVVSKRLPTDTYPSLTLLGEEALGLRGGLVMAQATLHELASTHDGNAGYQALRDAIRGYITAQLTDEARLIAPAFQGRGPRR